MKKFMSTVKTRWNAAPTWVKTLDVTCWVGLLAVMVVYLV